MISLKSGTRVSRTGGFVLILLTAVASSLALAGAASAQTLTTLTNFDRSSGAYPFFGSLIADANGDLFGTTWEGGTSNMGVVFEILKTASGYDSTPKILVNFGTDGNAYPYAGLIADANGDLFGTTFGDQTVNKGTVFEIAYDPATSTYASTPVTLATFNGANGAYPYTGLMADANGNLFGTTAWGGSGNWGTVFEVPKTSSGYTPLVSLVSFNWADGVAPFAGLIADANGDLFGTTEGGGSGGAGTVFEIINTSSGYSSTPTTLVNFDFTHAYPYGNLIADANGDLFGETHGGGGLSDLGAVFEVVNSSSGYSSTPKFLAGFSGEDGGYPYGGLIADANGSLFGTTYGGGVAGYGTVFEIPFDTSTGSYASAPVTLFSFDYTDGVSPEAGLIADGNGNLFGTTDGGGTGGFGTVFELAGSGFVPPKRFAGTPGTSNCTGVSISTLAQTYGGIAHAAAGLGYATVADLQSAVGTWCSQ